MKRQIIRKAYLAKGQVQGVGFRPFVWRLAREDELCGFVRNTALGVQIEVQGSAEALNRFAQRLEAELPPLAHLGSLTGAEIAPKAGEQGFAIIESESGENPDVLISPDIAVCADCLADMADPENPRHAYPFTNCTNCGPRFSITRAIPYDRASTSMACFELCQDCAREYADPQKRRFHAQPIACPHCGPRLWYVDKKTLALGLKACAPDSSSCPSGKAAIAKAAELLKNGGILAIKGLGGFQLACDARSESAVNELRRRKQRPHKAFALMLPTIEACEQFCALSDAHRQLLSGAEKPIVLCPRHPKPLSPDFSLASSIAPDSCDLGLMLPYTPLHFLLLEALKKPDAPSPVLVMSSANPHAEPLCLGNREALQRLAHLADAWLLHERDILVRVDDSVLGIRPDGQRYFLRRARGYVPRPVSLAWDDAPDKAPVLGCGALLKATSCLIRGSEGFVGQHIGDLENPACLDFYHQSATHLEAVLKTRPKALVRDLHPDFLSSQAAEARGQREGLDVFSLQHHAAHAASVLAEHQILAPALALCLDGSGLGPDGTIWGGELLLLELAKPSWQRLGRIAPFDLPGGEAAIREPWRIAQALLLKTGQEGNLPAGIPLEARKAVAEMLARRLNCIQTSSCGRLFDAVAAQLGLCTRISYEGQAAIRLESAARAELARLGNVLPPKAWDLPLTSSGKELLELDSAALFARVLAAQKEGQSPGLIALLFQQSLALGLARLASHAAKAHGLELLGLSGGVMQNPLFAQILVEALSGFGLKVLEHQELPPGDGGLSLGQAYFGQRMLARLAGKEYSPERLQQGKKEQENANH